MEIRSPVVLLISTFKNDLYVTFVVSHLTVTAWGA